MIPAHVRDFLTNHHFMTVASRDEQLQPCVIRAFGMKIQSDLDTATLYIPAKDSERLIENWENNGRMAIIIVNTVTFESYQLKGMFISSRPNDDPDYQFQDKYIENIRKQMIDDLGLPAEHVTGLNFWNCKPGLAITFQVESVFGQTPGPKTGKRISGT